MAGPRGRGGARSIVDGNFFVWTKNNIIRMVRTDHVGNIIVLARKLWMTWSLDAMEKHFRNQQKDISYHVHTRVRLTPS